MSRGRAPLPLGTWGRIRTYPAEFNERGKAVRWKARTMFRDVNGRTRQIEKWGTSGADAESRLKTALLERSRLSQDGQLTGLDRFSKAAEMWRAGFEDQVHRGVRSPGTLETYERHLNGHVLPALGDVRLLEITPPLLDRLLLELSRSVGTSSAKASRSVISGALGLAVRYGAIPTNPVRDATRLETTAKKEPRALTLVERRDLLTALEKDKVAVEADLPDLVRFMLATGQRIGECLAVLWMEVDFTASVVEVNATVIRWTGHGLIRKATKSRAGQRRLVLPTWAMADLVRRRAVGIRLDEPVFADTLGGMRDPKNTRRSLRAALDRAGFKWVTSHNFRKTTATLLDEAGLSARVIADQLGHARPSMTQDVYMGRRSVDPRAVQALEAALSWDDDEN